MKMLCHDARDANPGCLDGQDLIDRLVRKQPFKFFSHLVKQICVHLMIQKTVNL